MKTSPTQLKRELGLFGAVMLGMGSIVGTGVFVSIGIGAGVAGPAVILAIALAALVALCNGLSSAQLAASHPVSGGTYEYGYKYATPALGFTAGWMFLCAKSASAATAALGGAGYLMRLVDPSISVSHVGVGIVMVILLTVVTLTGMRRTNGFNITIVLITLMTLLFFVFSGLPGAMQSGRTHLIPFFEVPQGEHTIPAILHASALMFVAYTGYGRIATMGEEVHDPKRTIPRAILITLIGTMFLYMAVGTIAVTTVGSGSLYEATLGQAAPLEVISRTFQIPGLPAVLAVGAVTAMMGVLLNLILGLSRVVLAMGRRGEMPALVGQLDRTGSTPVAAVVLVGLIISGLVLIGDVKTTWSFSAFTVLIYYAITNLCALRLPSEQKLYPRWIAVMGLIACLGLAFLIEPQIWLVGLGLIGVGLLWHGVAARIGR